MLLTVPILYGVSVAAAVAVDPRGNCNHDNCLRAVIASAFPGRSGGVDCSSYLSATVTPAVPPGSPTVTVCNAVPAGPVPRDHGGAIVARQMTIIPSHIPAYASACSGRARYSSACSCVGVTAVTSTAPTPTAFTATLTSAVAVIPTLNAVQFYNGFVCDPVNNIVTNTPAPLDQCIATTLSYSLNFLSFIPGGLTAGQCSVNFYTTHDCSGGAVSSAPVDSTKCFNFLTLSSIMLVCSCPVKG